MTAILRHLARLAALHGRRLDAHIRAIRALAGRLDLEMRANDRQDQALTELEARVADLEARLFPVGSRLKK